MDDAVSNLAAFGSRRKNGTGQLRAISAASGDTWAHGPRFERCLQALIPLTGSSNSDKSLRGADILSVYRSGRPLERRMSESLGCDPMMSLPIGVSRAEPDDGYGQATSDLVLFGGRLTNCEPMRPRACALR